MKISQTARSLSGSLLKTERTTKTDQNFGWLVNEIEASDCNQTKTLVTLSSFCFSLTSILILRTTFNLTARLTWLTQKRVEIRIIREVQTDLNLKSPKTLDSNDVCKWWASERRSNSRRTVHQRIGSDLQVSYLWTIFGFLACFQLRSLFWSTVNSNILFDRDSDILILPGFINFKKEDVVRIQIRISINI